MESIIEKVHPPYSFYFSSNPNSINIKIKNNNSTDNDDAFENSFTLKKLQKSKVFSNKKNTNDIIKGIIYFIEQNKIIYEQKDDIFKLVLTSYNKRQIEFPLKKIEKNLNELNFILVKALEGHSHRVSCVSIFPSGNFVSVSCDKSIKIWNVNYDLMQSIEEAHDDYINYVNIKEENNFATCARDRSIKIWVKNEKDNKFALSHTVKDAHESWVFKIIYLSNYNIISCSYDKTVKIWEKKGNDYINIKILEHSNIVYSILFLKDKNILIASGEFGTKIYNFNNYECISELNDVKCWNWNSLCKLDENKILIGGTHGIIKVISLNDYKVVKEINNGFNCWGVGVIDKINSFITVGEGKNVKIYKKSTYDFIKDVNDIHQDDIEGINTLNYNTILTYSWDKTIKIWRLE